jgi:uncharacterized repeat protein (TIGR03803 family)
MKRLNLSRCGLSVCAAPLLLSACGGSQPLIGAPSSMAQAPAIAAAPAIAHHDGTASPSYQLLHSFAGAPSDGATPWASLIDVNGTLYGTTGSGGTRNYGTVFSITTAGAAHVLYSFGSGSDDGSVPYASLINVKGTLYGTAVGGGTYGDGTVFSITTDGTEHVLHSFAGYPSDGRSPEASLTDVKGTLYGTTSEGGEYGYPPPIGNGTVFSMSRAGSELVLHDFGSSGDGVEPAASLIAAKGMLYGTTFAGGEYGPGTVFSIGTDGTEHVLHSFGNGSDGQLPRAGLINVKGTLYGTTYAGGLHNAGTVFSIGTDDTEHVLFSFTGKSSGAKPWASLIDVNGILYGTTSTGGTYNEGTVFSVSTTGTENVLYNFTGKPDGANPVASLIDVNGTLYGTTLKGGIHNDGTVFALTP